MQAGFARTDITPKARVSLAGYFTERKSTGVLDPLQGRSAVFGEGKDRIAIISLDLVALSHTDVQRIRKIAEKRTGIRARRIIIATTHTHTGPATIDAFAAKRDGRYISGLLIPRIARCIEEAVRTQKECSVSLGIAREEGLAFARRYWKADGTVITNPPKVSAYICNPEGKVDHTVGVLLFRSDSRIEGLLVLAANHCDTIGGCKISADWPGHLERMLERALRFEGPVLTLIGPQGNVNHLDPERKRQRFSSAESRRIARGYARFVAEAVESARSLKDESLALETTRFRCAYRKVPREEIARARRLLAGKRAKGSKELTSLDLARGSEAVEQIFARALVEFVQGKRPADDFVEVTALRLGNVAIVTLPGEPFSDIGFAIRGNSPFRNTFVVALANGYAGYIPMPEHFKRGGYEVRTTPLNRFHSSLGPKMVEVSLKMLRRLK